MTFSKFAKTLEQIERTSSRNEMTRLVAELIKSLPESEIGKALYLLTGRVVPRYIPLEFNVASKLIMRAFSKAFNKDLGEIEVLYKKLGDLGLAAESLISSDKSTITISAVYGKLYEIAVSAGKDSQLDKVDKIVSLIESCDRTSARYVIRVILGSLRLGVSDKTILDALSFVLVGDKSMRPDIEKAYGVQSDIGNIAEVARRSGVSGIKEITIKPGTPVASMLCEREPTLGGVLARINPAIIQPKYDGIRCQLHFSKEGFGKLVAVKTSSQNTLLGSKKEQVRIFSRNLESLSDMFPEIVSRTKYFNCKEAIIDGEAAGYDYKKNKILPFQETIQRRRKYEIKEKAKDIPVRLFVFDLLYLDGKDLTLTPYENRFEKLKDAINKPEAPDIITLIQSEEVRTETEMDILFKDYVKQGLEGIIAKAPSSFYSPGKRGFDWIKYKRSAQGYLVDTVDTVVMGYYKGRGVRAKFGIGAILVGVLSKKTDAFESVAKVGTGIKDIEWGKMRDRLDRIKVDRKPDSYKVVKGLGCDVWVRPEVVVVVEADEITKSKNHMAGFKAGMGYSLRFPRLKVFDRKDKGPEDITTVKEIEELAGF